jgi:hypothetical protein
MKRLVRTLALLMLLVGLSWQAAWATLPQQAQDKATLGTQIEQLLRKSSLWNASKARVELIVRVLEDGSLELLDIEGEVAQAVVAVRVVIAFAKVDAAAQLTGKAFHFVVEDDEAMS